MLNKHLRVCLYTFSIFTRPTTTITKRANTFRFNCMFVAYLTLHCFACRYYNIYKMYCGFLLQTGTMYTNLFVLLLLLSVLHEKKMPCGRVMLRAIEPLLYYLAKRIQKCFFFHSNVFFCDFPFCFCLSVKCTY